MNVVWRPVTGQLRAIPLAYHLGIELHRLGRPDARFSPTIQVPVAPGAPNDPMRVRRRVVPAIIERAVRRWPARAVRDVRGAGTRRARARGER